MVEVSSSTIESIIAHSPLLEELRLDDCPHSEMTIRAPNLKYFHYDHIYGHLSLCTPLLEKLEGNLIGTKHFSVGVRGSLVFRYLRIIELSYVPFDKIEVTSAVIRLITSSPNLHKLEISVSCADITCSTQTLEIVTCVLFCTRPRT